MLELDQASKRWLKSKNTSRNSGASVFFIAFLILSPTALLLYVANTELHEAWITVAEIISGGIAIGSFQHAIRHDPCSGASLCVILGLIGAFVGGLGIAIGTSWVFLALLVGSLATVALSGAYLLWRHHGREYAPDLLGNEEGVYETGGVAVRWRAREYTVPAGQVVWVVVELQNAWRSPAKVEVQLRKIGRRSPLALPLRIVGTLEGEEVGTLEIPVPSKATGSGRAEIRIVIHARPLDRWRGRSRLRPHAPFPLGPAWLLDLLAIAAMTVQTYYSASLSVNVEASPEPHPAHPDEVEGPLWKQRWARDDIATTADTQASSWVQVRARGKR